MSRSQFRTTELSDPAFEAPNLRFLTVKTATLHGRGDICLFVPDDAPRHLPLVVLLHGVYGSAWCWSQKGGAVATARAMIAAGEIGPCVIAMPSDGLWGDGSGYLAHHGRDFGRWIANEVPAAVREQIPTVTTRSPRFLAGLSMGGYGALRLGGAHPERFAGISAHSAITELADMAAFVEEPLTKYEQPGRAAVIDDWIAHRGRTPPLRFDCGTDDDLLPANRRLHRQLTAAGIDHEYHEFPGGHEWPYWIEHLRDTLRFFDRLARTG